MVPSYVFFSRFKRYLDWVKSLGFLQPIRLFISWRSYFWWTWKATSTGLSEWPLAWLNQADPIACSLSFVIKTATQRRRSNVDECIYQVPSMISKAISFYFILYSSHIPCYLSPHKIYNSWFRWYLSSIYKSVITLNEKIDTIPTYFKIPGTRNKVKLTVRLRFIFSLSKIRHWEDRYLLMNLISCERVVFSSFPCMIKCKQKSCVGGQNWHILFLGILLQQNSSLSHLWQSLFYQTC